MEYFSHSKIQTFNQCKQKYKLQYIDKIKIKVPFTIEGFMGSIVHDCLEEIFRKNISIDETKSLYKKKWFEKFSTEIKIVNNDANFYFIKGEDMLLNFYNNFYKRDVLKTIELETKKYFKLNEEILYHIRIDRLAKDKTNNIYIIDYKTTNSPKTLEQLKYDEQLLSYSTWVNENYPKREIILEWNFLVNNEKIQIKTDEKKIFEIKKKLKDSIKKINEENSFEYNISKLCNWCLFKPYCKAWNKQQKQMNLLDF